MSRPALLASCASAVLIAALLALALVLSGVSSDATAQKDRLAAFEARLERLERVQAASEQAAEQAAAEKTAAEGTPAATGESTTPAGSPALLAELQSQLEALSERVNGLEDDPVRRAFAFALSENEQLRFEGVRGLERLGRFDPDARAALRALLDDPSPRVRREAIQAAGNTRDKEAVPKLLEALADSDPQIRAEAIDSLGEIGAAEAGAAISQSLSDPSQAVREQAADVLGVLKAKNGVGGLLQALEDPSEAVRGQAIASLGEIGEASAAPALRKLWDGDPGPHRMRLILALHQLGDDHAFRSEIDRLSRIAAADADAEARRQAIRGLASFARAESQAVFEKALEDPSALVRAEAQRFLRR